MLTTMQRDHLKAERDATVQGRPFAYVGRFQYRGRGPEPTAHIKAWRDHKINAVLDDFIARYSLQQREHAGGPI